MYIKPNLTKIISSIIIIGLLSLVVYEGKAKADLESSLKDSLVSTGKFIYNDENGNQVVLDAEDLRTLADTIDENKNTSDQQIDELNNDLSVVSDISSIPRKVGRNLVSNRDIYEITYYGTITVGANENQCIPTNIDGAEVIYIDLSKTYITTLTGSVFGSETVGSGLSLWIYNKNIYYLNTTSRYGQNYCITVKYEKN